MRRIRLAVYFALPVIIVGLLVLSQFALSSGQGAWQSIQSLWGATSDESTVIDIDGALTSAEVTAVIEKVQDKSVEDRESLLDIIKNGQYTQAIPVIQGIIADSTEDERIRAIALQVLHSLDAETAAAIAQNYTTGNGALTKAAKAIIN
jgi:hypothetical protein